MDDKEQENETMSTEKHELTNNLSRANFLPFKTLSKVNVLKKKLSNCNKISPTPSCSHRSDESDHLKKQNVKTNSSESFDQVCRICHDNPSKSVLITPCLCKGSMGLVHQSCLERWLGESAKNCCEICNFQYNTIRVPKYHGFQSFLQWIQHPVSRNDTRNLFFDIACFFILTPLAAVSAWLCIVGAQHYSFGNSVVSSDLMEINIFTNNDEYGDPLMTTNSTWTSIGLLSLTGTLLAAYYIWLFVAIRYHIQIWNDWQQRNYIVTILPYEENHVPESTYTTRALNNNPEVIAPIVQDHPIDLQVLQERWQVSDTVLYQSLYGHDSFPDIPQVHAPLRPPEPHVAPAYSECHKETDLPNLHSINDSNRLPEDDSSESVFVVVVNSKDKFRSSANSNCNIEDSKESIQCGEQDPQEHVSNPKINN